MSEETPSVLTDDLDAFNDELHGRSTKEEVKAETAIPDETEKIKEDAPEPEVKQETDDDTVDEDDQTEEEEKPQPKKNRFQERIDKLTGEKKDAERKFAELEARLKDLETPKTEVPTQTDKSSGPTPEDLNEDGTEKYPLGEFDPRYIRDLTKHAIAEERQEALRKEAQTAEAQRAETEKNIVVEEWNQKLVPAQERYPDYMEKGQELVSTFEGIDENYGDYLASTIMSMDHGTDVFYYLANNIDEAKGIWKLGATKATIALGRLEAQFDKKEVKPRVSSAPTPPPANKGSAVSKSVSADTDNLDAFSDLLFKK